MTIDPRVLMDLAISLYRGAIDLMVAQPGDLSPEDAVTLTYQVYNLAADKVLDSAKRIEALQDAER